jgi:hypothetical protein
MTTRIRRWERTPGGFAVTVEVTDAYTDGSSRFDTVYLTRDEVRGKSSHERRQAVFDALNDDPLEGIHDALVTQPAQTKDILEARAVALYDTWLRWKTTRVEAESRGVAAGVITSLTNRENATWDNYAEALLAWRAASS